jgi:1,5-anhydro-D-fructose reductase (1,5-anhydro-D-mannitol-forming)
MTGRRLGWGLIGASTIASDYMVAAIRADSSSYVVGVASASEPRARAFAQEHDIGRWHGSVESLLDDDEVEAVYVSTRNDRHREATLAAARAGKAVLCEKPIALSLADAREMVAACEAAGVLLAVNHHFRNTVLHRRVRGCIQAGLVGQPLAIRIFHPVVLPDHLRTWRLADRAGGGAILDLTVHDADLVLFLTGAEPEQALAVALHQGTSHEGVEDGVVAVVRTADGPVVVLHDTFSVLYAPSAIEVHGSTGSLLGQDVMNEDRTGQLWLMRRGAKEELTLDPWENPYELAVTRFREALTGNGAPAATAEEGVRALAVALAVRASAREGREVAIQ